MGGGRRERKKERKEGAAKKSGTPGAGQMASSNTRYLEVKVETKIQTPPGINSTISGDRLCQLMIWQEQIKRWVCLSETRSS